MSLAFKKNRNTDFIVQQGDQSPVLVQLYFSSFDNMITTDFSINKNYLVEEMINIYILI